MSASTVWQDCNGSTKDFLSVLKQELYHNHPFEGRFKSYAWEFACILRTRLCYIEAFEKGSLDFSVHGSIKEKSFYEDLNVEEVKKMIASTGVRITELLRIPHSEELALWLCRHESMHHGKLILYFAHNNLPTPERVKHTWGESNF